MKATLLGQVFRRKCAHFHLICIKCVHFHLICIKCTHFQNLNILRSRRLINIGLSYIYERPKIKGGLRLVDLRKRDSALKIHWLNRIHDSDGVLMELAYYHIHTTLNSELLWECNFHTDDVKYACKAKGVWLSVIKAWATFHYESPSSKNEVMNQVMWFNSHLRVKGKPFMWKKTG